MQKTALITQRCFLHPLLAFHAMFASFCINGYNRGVREHVHILQHTSETHSQQIVDMSAILAECKKN